MYSRSLLVSAALALHLATPAWAADVKPVINISTALANDLRGLAFGADGKIYASGHAGTDEKEFQTVVARVNADGALDAGFGSGGVAKIDLAPGRGEQSLSMVALADGDVLVGVNAVEADAGQSIYLLRLDSAGKRKVAPAWGDAEGKVEVVLGWANAENAPLPDGKRAIDTSWDMKIDRSSGTERVVVFAMGSAAKGSNRSDIDRYIIRLNAANGSPDPSFNGGKPVALHTAGDQGDNARRGLVEADGSIVAAGYTPFGKLGAHIVLTRLTPAGALDTSFGNVIVPASSGTAVGMTPRPGVAVFDLLAADGGFTEAYGVVKQSNGNYVTSGYGATTAAAGASTLGFKTSEGPDLVTMRTNGSAVDTSYGKEGVMAVQSEGMQRPSAEDRGRGLVLLKDDRTVQVGRFGGNAALFVFTKDGRLDLSVDGDGIIEVPDANIDAQLFNVVASPDGSRIAATTNAHPKGARLVVFETKAFESGGCDE